MGLSLNFKAIPAPPYHTLKFHFNRGVRQKIYSSRLEEAGGRTLIDDLSVSLRNMIQIPDYFSICVLPARLYATSILKDLFPPGIHWVTSLLSAGKSNNTELSFTGLEEKILFPGTPSENVSGMKKGAMLLRDTDPVSGLNIGIPEILSTCSDNPAIRVCVDISTSLINHPFDYERIDAYLFNTEFVFGFQPGISILVVREDIQERIRQKWMNDFISPAGNNKMSHPDILCHREVDLLRLYVFTEMCNDFVRRDPKIIRNEIIYKSILITNALNQSDFFELMIKNEKVRSQNIISARLLGSIEKVRNHFNRCGIQADEIPEKKYGYIFRFGNYPVHSKEQTEYLTDCIGSL